MCNARSMQQRLAGDAAGPGAITPELVLLDQQNVGAKASPEFGCDQPGRAAADHDKVVAALPHRLHDRSGRSNPSE